MSTASSSAVPVLAVEGLAKSFGAVEAVAEVGFTLAAGELLALIGPNGAGKSTCFNLINGQLRPDRGRVALCGEEVTGLAPRLIWRRGVGRSFQVAATFGSMTVLENLQAALLSHHRQLHGWWRSASRYHRQEALLLLERVGMAGQAERLCGLLAYGDVKRVELALALANAPRLLLMDEPTAGMAPEERGSLMRLVEDLARRDGIAVLFTEHDMEIVFGHAARVLVMNRGRLVAEGRPEQVRSDPLVREIYLGSL